MLAVLPLRLLRGVRSASDWKALPHLPPHGQIGLACVLLKAPSIHSTAKHLQSTQEVGDAMGLMFRNYRRRERHTTEDAVLDVGSSSLGPGADVSGREGDVEQTCKPRPHVLSRLRRVDLW